jgi:predicted transposase YbfD/YdcC
VTTWRVSVAVATPSQADYPGLRSVVLIDKTTVRKRDGRSSQEQRSYASSLGPEQKSPAQLLGLIRGHWGGVEIRNHWRRDACWREDQTRTRNARALANLALLRSALLRVCATHWPDLSLPRVFETCQHSLPKALRALHSRR